jgi:hypothetical protein
MAVSSNPKFVAPAVPERSWRAGASRPSSPRTWGALLFACLMLGGCDVSESTKLSYAHMKADTRLRACRELLALRKVKSCDEFEKDERELRAAYLSAVMRGK